MVTAQERSAPSSATPAELTDEAKRSSGQTKPLCIDGRPARQAVIRAPSPNVTAFVLANSMNEVTTLPAMLLLSNTYNAAVQPQIRAQREFVGWNCLLGDKSFGLAANAAMHWCLSRWICGINHPASPGEFHHRAFVFWVNKNP